MNTRKFLSATLFAFAAVLCLALSSVCIQAQSVDVDDSNLETQLYLIVGTNQTVEDPRMPVALDSVMKQLRASLPFKNYRLAATLINRVKNEGRLELSWVGGSFTLPPNSASASASSTLNPSLSQFKVRQVKLARNAENQPMVQMLGFNFGTRIPIQTGAIASSGGVVPTVQYEGTGVATDISMREGDPVIVGTLNIGPSGDAIILVVAAKRTAK